MMKCIKDGRDFKMQTKFIKVQDELYKAVGNTLMGYKVYKITKYCSTLYLGQSQCQTPKMAVNDVLQRANKRYY